MSERVTELTTNNQQPTASNHQPKTNDQQPTTSLREDDLLWRHLKTVPAFRALLRAVEARFYRHTEMPQPILDIGCGDGHFSQMTFDQPMAVGVDPWWGPLKKAQTSAMYDQLVQSRGDRLPFSDNHFGTIISNSVLEHIPDIQAVLDEAGRVLQPGGKLVITMPCHHFTEQLGGAKFFERLGAPGLADRYRRLFNFIARHVHTDPPEVWAERLAQAGFAVDRWQYYFSQKALHALEWGHIQGLPSAILQYLTGHWILGPWESSLKRTEQWVRPYYEEPFTSDGAYIFITARKEADGPIAASLPAANPFSVAELLASESVETKDDETTSPEIRNFETTRLETDAISDLQSPALSPQPPISRPEPLVSKPKSPINPNIIPVSLLAAAILCAATGQAILSANPPEPTAGLRWYGYSLIPLLLLVWQQRRINWPALPQWQRPRLGPVPRRRWYFFLALFFALLAPRIVNNPSSDPQPGFAILIWLAGIATAVYALRTDTPIRFTFKPSRFTLLAGGALFLTAFFARAVNLTRLPFILNGAEASIGLDVVQIANGVAKNPFATGWLTNPTLPYFLMAWPVQWLGASTLAIRLLSPLVGALTVVLTFWLGKRLFGTEVGLIAAVLLTGSHLHLHYSRLGMTNIWDPMITLLALGLLAVAWQQKEEGDGGNGRIHWLLAGTAVGLNAYLFTSSHLLPLMLVVMAVVALLFDRHTVRKQWRNILAAAGIAFIIALPQLSYYNNNPTIFMDRARALGIFEGQTGWLAQEAARTGTSQGELLRDQFVKTALSFHYTLDKSGSYRPERPLLGYGMAILSFLGIAAAVIRLRQLRYSLLLAWIIIPLIFAGAILLESPSSHRLVIAIPALCLLAAIGLVETGKLFLAGRQKSQEADENASPAHPFTRSPAFLPILLSIAMLLALLDINFYFGAYRQQHSFADRNTEIADEMAAYLNELNGHEWTAYFFGPPSMYIGFPTITYLVEDFQPGRNLYDVNVPDEPLAPAQTNGRTYIFLPERSGEIEAIMGLYPNGRLRTFSGFHADPLFYTYEVQE